jgi:hypothetical protein
MVLLCACSKQATTVPSDFSLTLDRSGCMGSCPVYEVSLAANGVVTLDGREYLKAGLPSSWTLSTVQRQRVFERLRRGPFLNLTQKRVGAACVQFWSDNPGFRISAVVDGTKHELWYNYGCRTSWWALHDQDVVEGLKALGDDLDTLIGTSGIH